MNAPRTATCKRCGSTGVAWVQSKRTGRHYLALATVGTSRDGSNYGKVIVYPQTPHDCHDATKGGRQDPEHPGQ